MFFKKFFKLIGNWLRGRVLILSLILLFFPLSFWSSELTLTDIPQFPGSTLRYSHYYGRENIQAEYWIFLSEGLTPQEIGDYGVSVAEKYINMMKDKGWTLKKENRQRKGGEFIFKKDIIKQANITIAPSAKAIEGKMKNYVFLRVDLKRLIPFEDIIGIDPSDVPRYPGSIRVRWMNLLGDFAVKYLVVDSEKEVKDFFEKKIPKYGWEPSKGVGMLNYQKGGVKSPEEISPEEILPHEKRIGRIIKRMIPTTLSVTVSEKEGIVEIGIGRSAGSADLGKAEEKIVITPPKKIEERKEKVLTFVDVKEIPVYEGLIKKSLRKEPVNHLGEENIRIKYVKKGAEQKEALKIAQFYLKEMKKRSWRLADEEWYGIGRKALFKKGAVRVKIEIKAVGRFPIPKKAPKINIPVEVVIILPVPTEDIAGKDIKDVPRFPGSVRFYYLEAATDHIVKFKAVGSAKEVEWFFIEELPKKGWTFAGNDKTGLLFVPASTAKSPAQALAKGKLIPTTLKVKVDDQGDGTIKIGMDLTKGD
ncbi:MAG: hypothetical protein ACE5WD_13235 [Candidatus Aminicenantia bacterium]